MGTVLVLGAFALVLVVALAAIVVGQAVVVRHRAAAGADLAALAAARAAADNVPAPCRAARVVADRNGARLTACRVDHRAAVTVSVVVRTRGMAGFDLRGAGTARAAPTGLSG